MRRTWILWWGLVGLAMSWLAMPLAAQDFDLEAPLSTKIWDDPSLSNLSSKGHTFLGYATVTLGGTAVVLQAFDLAPPRTVHWMGTAASVSAGLTVTAGLVAHLDRLSFSGDLVTWDNLHALAAAVGSSTLAGSGFVAPGNTRAAWQALGVALLGLAIILEG